MKKTRLYKVTKYLLKLNEIELRAIKRRVDGLVEMWDKNNK